MSKKKGIHGPSAMKGQTSGPAFGKVEGPHVMTKPKTSGAKYGKVQGPGAMKDSNMHGGMGEGKMKSTHMADGVGGDMHAYLGESAKGLKDGHRKLETVKATEIGGKKHGYANDSDEDDE